MFSKGSATVLIQTTIFPFPTIFSCWWLCPFLPPFALVNCMRAYNSTRTELERPQNLWHCQHINTVTGRSHTKYLELRGVQEVSVFAVQSKLLLCETCMCLGWKATQMISNYSKYYPVETTCVLTDDNYRFIFTPTSCRCNPTPMYCKSSPIF